MRISDWSSDVCSSDLLGPNGAPTPRQLLNHTSGVRDALESVAFFLTEGLFPQIPAGLDRKSVASGKSVSVRVDLGGRRIIKKKQSRRTKHRQHREPTPRRHDVTT